MINILQVLEKKCIRLKVEFKENLTERLLELFMCKIRRMWTVMVAVRGKQRNKRRGFMKSEFWLKKGGEGCV